MTSETTPKIASNFAFLAAHSPHLVKLGSQAERYLADDPNTCLIKLRQYAEVMVQQVAAKVGLYTTREDSFKDLLDLVRDRQVLTPEVSRLFHGLRRAGNAAAHELVGKPDEVGLLRFRGHSLPG